MLLGLDPLVEGVRSITGQHLDRNLGDDRTVVHFLVDQVNRYTCHLDTMFECSLDGSRSRKGREQRGMDIEDPPWESVHEDRGQYTHESSQHHTLGTAVQHRIRQRLGEGRPIGVIGVADDDSVDSRSLRPAQGSRFWPVRDDRGDVRTDRRRIQEGLQIGT